MSSSTARRSCVASSTPVDVARRTGRAYVRILDWGTVGAIRDALEQQRFHVLHVSCHAEPDALLLEDERGEVDRVDAERFVYKALAGDRTVPLVVLSGCSTALSARAESAAAAEGEAALPGLARELLANGVPAVVAMTAPVTDRYATELGARCYRELARRDVPDPLAVLSDVRRGLEDERRRAPAGDRGAPLVEWATPTLFVRGPGLPLFDRTAGFEEVRAPAEPDFGRDMVVRRVGDFVGRRHELRELLRALRGPKAAS